MKKRITSICSFISLFLLLSDVANADEVILKNGGKIKGIIAEENMDKVVLQIKSGKVTFKKEEVDSIKKSLDENLELEKNWSENEEEVTQKKGLTITKETKKIDSASKPSKPVSLDQKKFKGVISSPEYRLGEIFDVKCDDNKHSYSACLPKTYDGTKRCPVMFCFDPGGDGRNAVRQFMFASEKYGWIVIGSNDAKNGPWEKIEEAQGAMMQDIKTRFNVDNAQFYAGGFSGGARMSYAIAYKYPMSFRGIIPCGAGFGLGSASNRVAVFQCVGKDDVPAQLEMIEVESTLKDKRVNFKIKEFNGKHNWPPREVLEEAVAWLLKQ